MTILENLWYGNNKIRPDVIIGYLQIRTDSARKGVAYGGGLLKNLFKHKMGVATFFSGLRGEFYLNHFLVDFVKVFIVNGYAIGFY